jgi:hypothetical protein
MSKYKRELSRRIEKITGEVVKADASLKAVRAIGKNLNHLVDISNEAFWNIALDNIGLMFMIEVNNLWDGCKNQSDLLTVVSVLNYIQGNIKHIVEDSEVRKRVKNELNRDFVWIEENENHITEIKEYRDNNAAHLYKKDRKITETKAIEFAEDLLEKSKSILNKYNSLIFEEENLNCDFRAINGFNFLSKIEIPNDPLH